MPKGTKTAPKGFLTYRERQSPVVQAMKSDEAFKLQNTQFDAGDFIVLDPDDGTLVGMASANFLAKYELRRATWSRKKKADAAPVDGQAEVAQEATN